MTGRNAPKDYELTCWYLNLRRAGKLIGIDQLAPQLASLNSISEAQGLRGTAIITFFERHPQEWLAAANSPTLGQLMPSGWANSRPSVSSTVTTRSAS